MEELDATGEGHVARVRRTLVGIGQPAVPALIRRSRRAEPRHRLRGLRGSREWVGRRRTTALQSSLSLVPQSFEISRPNLPESRTRVRVCRHLLAIPNPPVDPQLATTLKWATGKTISTGASGRKTPDEIERNPIPAEFFVSESRELADNLGSRSDPERSRTRDRADARYIDSPRAVRFYLSRVQEGALPQGPRRPVVRSHSASTCSKRRQADLPKPAVRTGSGWEECAYPHLRGLRHPRAWRAIPAQSESAPHGAPADFYNFFRAEALSSKGDGKGGTWGVGKTVFPMASRANAFVGLTVQEGNSRRLLMGRCILRYHKTSAGRPHLPI